MMNHPLMKSDETDTNPEKDERLVRFMALATPMGYAAARSAVDALTTLINAELASKEMHARVWQEGFDAVNENAHVDWVVNHVPENPYEKGSHE